MARSRAQGRERAPRHSRGGGPLPGGCAARRARISRHSRLVLATTAVLVVGGWLLFTLFEWRITFREMPAWVRVLNGLFMSVTARTGGFNTSVTLLVAGGNEALARVADTK